MKASKTVFLSLAFRDSENESLCLSLLRSLYDIELTFTKDRPDNYRKLRTLNIWYLILPSTLTLSRSRVFLLAIVIWNNKRRYPSGESPISHRHQK